jgi:hypothetical protein
MNPYQPSHVPKHRLTKPQRRKRIELQENIAFAIALCICLGPMVVATIYTTIRRLF